MKKIMLIAAAIALVAGCSTKSVMVEGAGMYANAKTGIVGIGSMDIEAIPEATESAFIRYEEDTAWLSPSTKTHGVKIVLTGKNSTAHIDSVVSSICKAFSSKTTAEIVQVEDSEKSDRKDGECK